MENKDFENKLQQGYQKMTDQIADFIDKEGKTVKEAVDAAEDKLSEWGELTREEVEKISFEVRHDVGHFGETWEEAKTYFQQKLSFNAEYLKESMWDNLSGLANNATLDFIEFQKDLKQRISEGVDDVEQDANEQRNTHQKWLTEIYLWQQEHQDATKKLELVTQALTTHSDQLQQHAQEIQTHIKQDKETNKDKQRLQLHQQQMALHSKLKQEQQQIIILIEKLYKLLH